MPLDSVGSPTWWAGFLALIFTLLALDLGVFRRGANEMTMKAAAGWTALWVTFATLFGAFVGYTEGPDPALLFATAYVVELALSVDNVFVFGVIFTVFAVPRAIQHRVLFWGILGALVLRGLFIGIGAAAVQAFQWTLYVFGAILIWTAIKLLISDDDAHDPEATWLVKITRRLIPITDGYRGEAFFVLENGKRFATPLFVVLIAVEGSDVLFAVDSIPAVFGITSDPFIIYTSNIFAILGLRSLYFLVSALMGAFHYLKIGLSVILAFIGLKMLLHHWIVVPTPVSLGVIFSTLSIAIVASIIRNRMKGGTAGEPPAH